MIVDTLQNASKYFGVHPLFQQAFEYIGKTNIKEIEMGKFEISNGLKAIYSNKNGMTAAESIAKFECHNKNIDIQLCIHGTEQFAWKPRENCIKPNGSYNEDKDVQLYHDAPDMFFQLTAGQFVIFFPEDVHAPMIGDQEIRKLVIKVAK